MPDSPRLRRTVTIAIIGTLLLAVGLLLPNWWQRVRGMPPWPVPAARLHRAQVALPRLPVVTPRDLQEYEREFFGPSWSDVDENGCDTRNDILAVWLQNQRLDPAKPCVVQAGDLADPYTGHLIHFERGPGTSRAIEIDHVVALADAWRKGAWRWPASLALQFANDPANLIPVDGPANQAKGADDAASWLPPNEGFHCAYVVVQVLVKAAYGLGVSGAELAALREVLTGCEPADAGQVPPPAGRAPRQDAQASQAFRHFRLAAGRRCRCCPIRSQTCNRHPGGSPSGESRLKEKLHVRNGRDTRLQRQRPDAGPGLRVCPAEPAGREARAPPTPADEQSDARTRSPAGR